ncbi:MAG: membrane dipeptidase, partial [Myxococcota bacterium]
SASTSAPAVSPTAVTSAPAGSSPSARAVKDSPARSVGPRINLAETGAAEVVDLHVDTPWKVHFKGRDKKLEKGHATPKRVAQGHVAALVYPIYIPDYIHDSHPTIADATAIFDTIDTIVETHPAFHFAMRAGEAQVVPADDVAIFVSIEGAGAFAADIEAIDRFIARGVRLVGPVHARDSPLATSATGKGDGGLTELGKRFCERVYRAGALVDVSHMSDESFADLVPIAAKFAAPIVATHSNARKLRNHPRNLTDEQLRTIAKTGGVAGLNLYRNFIRKSKPRLKHVVAMVKHMVDVAGIEHIAIGSDFDGGTPVYALRNASKFPTLARALRKEGFEEEDVRKIFGKNARRILYWGVGEQR